jgi:hypothetical protein
MRSAFGWRGVEPPSETDADAREAHEELVNLLVLAGWEPVGETGTWYAERFRRQESPEAAQAQAPIAERARREVSAREPETVLLEPEAAVLEPEPVPVEREAGPVEGVRRPLPARVGIVVITVFSLLVVLFALLVFFGFFR